MAAHGIPQAHLSIKTRDRRPLSVVVARDTKRNSVHKMYEPSKMALFDSLLSILWFVVNLFFGGLFNNGNDAVEPYLLKDDILLLIKGASRESRLVYRSDIERDEDTSVFENALDKAVLQYESGVCYVSFKGSGSLDSIQSAPSLFPRQVCGAAGCCNINRNTAGAYFTSYVDELEVEVEECHSRCADGCPLVLTGYSQGGSIATIAAIALSQYNPILITYAQHPVAWRGCDVLDNMETYLRFTGICEVGGQPMYDSIPFFGNPFLTRHAGTKIMLGRGGAATVAQNGDRFFFPIGQQCHTFEPFNYAISNLLEAGPLDGYTDGATCSQNIECQSKVCSSRRCVR